MKIHHGLFIVTSLETGKEKIFKSFTCAHCGHVGVLDNDASKSQDGGMCLRCAKLLCRDRRCHTNCVPYAKKIGAY